jgi:putative hydrolase of the HAD superfamily
VTVRAVFFDFGGVLGRWDRAFVAAFEAEHGLAEGDVLKALYGTSGWRGAEIGELGVEDWFGEVDAAFKSLAGTSLTPAREIWSRLWSDIDHEVVELARRLSEAYTVGVLSNTTVLLEDELLARHGIHDMWHVIVNSARVGVAKPDARIYEIAAERAGVSPAECVHIDDMENNVLGADAAGFRGVHHRGGFAELKRALGDLGVAV